MKPWLYLFPAVNPHSLVVRGTHSQVRTATAVVRPSPRSHAKQPSSAANDTSVENSIERRQLEFDTSKWREMVLPQSSVSIVLLIGIT